MRRRLLLLLLGACAAEQDGSTPVSKSTPAVGVERLTVRVEHGDVVLSTDAGADVRVTGATVEIASGAITMSGPGTVVAPAGMDLVIVSLEGDVTLRGGWGAVTLSARNGAVTLDGAVAGGKMQARGNLACTLKNPPVADLVCESESGDIHVRLPTAFRGSINLRSGAGDVNAERHALMLLKHDSTDHNISGFVGPRLTVEELRAKRYPPGFWAHAKTGAVFFRVAD